MRLWDFFLENKAIDKHQFREEDASSNLYELLMRNILKKLSFLSLIPVQFFLSCCLLSRFYISSALINDAKSFS